MKRKLRMLSLVLIATMAVGMLSGCGNKDAKKSTQSSESKSSQVQAESSESNNSQTQTGVSEEITADVTYPIKDAAPLSFYFIGCIGKTTAYTDYDSVPFFAGYEKNTGVEIEWQTKAEGTDNTTAINLVLQNEELPNIFITEMDIAKRTELYEDGLIYDLTDYLPQYAPDFWEYINLPENAANKRAITNNDGRILAFPCVRESDFNITYTGPIIRKDWLDKLGLDMPVTLDDWEVVLKAFKENYGAYFSSALSRFNSAGLASGTGAYASTSFGLYVDNGEIKCANVQEEWKEMLTYLHRWYKEGLLDPDFGSLDDKSVRAKALSGECGIVYTATSQMSNIINDAELEGNGAEWVGLSYPRTAEGVATSYIQSACQTVNLTVSALVMTSCSEEELITAIKLLNYGFTEEGMIYLNFGEEGVSYEVAEDGSLKFTELLTKDERGLATAMIDHTAMYGGFAGIQMEEFVVAKNPQAAVDAIYTWIDNTEAAEHIVPPYTRTSEEQTTYSDIASVVKTYVSEMSLKFITGDESLENFDKFVDTLYSYDLQKLLDSEQAVYDRFVNN